MKGLMTRDEIKSNIKAIQINLQKEYDASIYLDEKKYTKKEEKYLEEAAINLRKVLHIIEIK
jgi:hypothetical protein